jgi:hypothetical protein
VHHSSALYNFLPEFTLRFSIAVRAQDRAGVYGMLNDVVIPQGRGIVRNGRVDQPGCR